MSRAHLGCTSHLGTPVIDIDTLTSACVHAPMHMYVHPDTHAHTHTHTHIHTHIHTCPAHACSCVAGVNGAGPGGQPVLHQLAAAGLVDAVHAFARAAGLTLSLAAQDAQGRTALQAAQ